LTKFDEKVVFGVFGEDDTLYLLSRKDAPKGKVLRLALTSGIPRIANATVVVPEASDSVIELTQGGVDPFVVTRSGLSIVEIVGGPHRIRQFALDGRLTGTIATPDVPTINEIVAAPNGEVLFNVVTFLNPGRWFSVASSAGGNSVPAPTLK